MFSGLNHMALKRIFSSTQSDWWGLVEKGKQFKYHKKEGGNIPKELEECPSENSSSEL